MKIIKDGHILDVTEKAYTVIYLQHGYTPYVEEPAKTRKTAKHKAGE